jgi:hypothetical protein
MVVKRKGFTLKNYLKIIVIIFLYVTWTSSKPIAMSLELKLIETRWDKHFENHLRKGNKPHHDFAKFQTLNGEKTFMVLLTLLPDTFDTKVLRKGNVFEVLLTSVWDQKAIDGDEKINIKNKSDLDRYETRMMMELIPK